MERSLDERAYALAVYMLEHDATVRAAAAKFGVSKSTVHKDLTERLRQRSPALHAEIRALLDRNKAERHIRGGMATKRKYEREAPKKNP